MAKKTRDPQVGLDSQCVSYFLDTIAENQDPTGTLAEEKRALIRMYFYAPTTFFASETVVTEVARIRNIDRREVHQRSVRFLIQGVPVRNRTAVDVRVKHLARTHPKLNDCRVLAEAEDLKLDILLTYDRKFKQRLNSASRTVKLMAPSTYWASLNIPKGAPPKTGPHYTHPLRKQSWWRW